MDASVKKEIDVSIVIPVYNDKDNILRAIKSALTQKNVVSEVIVVDDCSEQDIYGAIKQYINLDCVRYIRNDRNSGVAYSRNVGVKLAVGSYVAFLDSDDWWEEHKLERQLQLLKKKNADLICTGRTLVGVDGVHGKKISVPSEISYRQLLYHNYIACSSVVLKREIAIQYPMHDDDCHEDYICWLEIARDGHKMIGLDEQLLFYYLSPGGKSRNKLKSVYMTYRTFLCFGLNRIESLLHTVTHVVFRFIHTY